MDLKWFGILMTDAFGLNQFAPTASNIVLQTNPSVLDFGLQQANITQSDKISSKNKSWNNNHDRNGLLVAMTTTMTLGFGIQKTNNNSKSDKRIGLLGPQ